MSHKQDELPLDERLHRYHDRELDPAGRAELEAALDDRSRQKLAALDELGSALRATYGEATPPEFDTWPAIERGIAESKVIPLSLRLRRRAPLWISSLAVAAAVFAVLLLPSATNQHPSNDCEIDELEVSGANPTILKVPDDAHGGTTTVLWLEE